MCPNRVKHVVTRQIASDFYMHTSSRHVQGSMHMWSKPEGPVLALVDVLLQHLLLMKGGKLGIKEE